MLGFVYKRKRFVIHALSYWRFIVLLQDILFLPTFQRINIWDRCADTGPARLGFVAGVGLPAGCGCHTWPSPGPGLLRGGGRGAC